LACRQCPQPSCKKKNSLIFFQWYKEEIKTKTFKDLEKCRFEYSTKKPQIKEEIILTDFEENLFSFLLEVNKEIGKNTTLRVTKPKLKKRLQEVGSEIK
jgi:hypothetical protein